MYRINKMSPSDLYLENYNIDHKFQLPEARLYDSI